MGDQVDLHAYVLRWGKKHAGERIVHVRAGYLIWMVSNKAGPWEIAQQELDRRRIVIPEIEISGHAIDSASLRIRRVWHEHREKAEGLHGWLCRMAVEARVEGVKQIEGDVWSYLGVKWVYGLDGRFPVLKTVIPESSSRKRREGPPTPSPEKE